MDDVALQTMVDGATHDGDAVIIYDHDDRVQYVNQVMRDDYSFVDFDRPQTYDSVFMACVAAGTFRNPQVYRDPEGSLAKAKTMRRSVSYDCALRQHANGRWYIIKQRLFPDGRQVQVRIALSQPPEVSARSLDTDRAGKGDTPARVEEDPLCTPLRAAIDYLPFGLAVVKPDTALWHCNQAFAEFLDAPGPLHLDGMKLAIADDDLDTWLKRTVRRYASQHDQGAVAKRLLARPELGDCLRVAVWATATTQYKDDGHQPSAFVSVMHADGDV